MTKGLLTPKSLLHLTYKLSILGPLDVRPTDSCTEADNPVVETCSVIAQTFLGYR